MIIRKSLGRGAVGAAALLAGLLGTAPVLAADAGDPSMKVGYGDLNLATMNGASALYQRIEGAARFVCGERGRSLDDVRHWRQCYGNAVNQAVNEVNSPLLTSLYRKQYGAAPVTAMLAR